MHDTNKDNGARSSMTGIMHRLAATAASTLSAMAIAVTMQGAPAARADSPAAEPDVVGHWMTRDHDGVFEIGHCGQKLCGRLVGLRYTTEMPRDKRGQPECNLPMLDGFTPDRDEQGHWNGHVTDPDTGHVYHAKLWVSQSGDLKLRGFVAVPLFGETETWSRYTGTIGPACKLP
ncbi:MAG: DUF2147 domain-containing protein [Komagataeibacter saccharivorans]|uniref:DUF2147 domain-containing protein n=1 Tax=Komagataeibacter saccharivorans TaxID=265959 RepID=UPI0039E7A775